MEPPKGGKGRTTEAAAK